jgi:hypothetical protein
MLKSRCAKLGPTPLGYLKMTTSELEYLRSGPAKTVSQLVDSSTGLSNEELRAALSNALARVAEIEARWDLLARALRRFDEQYPDNART